MKKDATVALSGESADEVFGGYPWFHQEELLYVDKFPWLTNWKNTSSLLLNDVTTNVILSSILINDSMKLLLKYLLLKVKVKNTRNSVKCFIYF